MDEAADRDRGAADDPTADPAPEHDSHPEAPSDERLHEERLHDEAERVAVEGDDLSEIFYSVLGRERPHVDEPPPEGVSWPPPLRHDRSSRERSSRDQEHPDEQ